MVSLPLVKKIAPAKNKVVAIDPGVRSFISGYSLDHGFDFETQRWNIDKEHRNLDYRRSLRSKGRLSKRSVLLQEERIKSQIKTLHCRTARYLARKNEYIILGRIDSQSLVKGKKHQEKRNRDINTLSFYQFRQRMKLEAYKHNRKLILVREHYTTKTCGSCGNQYDIGTSKKYDCPTCLYKSDRDLNASRNMLIKFLLTWVSKKPWLFTNAMGSVKNDNASLHSSGVNTSALNLIYYASTKKPITMGGAVLDGFK